MTDITELAQSEINDALAQLKQISEYPTPSTQYARVLRKYILALVEALEKAQTKAIEQGRTACELFDEVTALRQRIAELESRTVKLPKPHAHLIWIQAGHAPDDYWDDVAVSHSEKDRCCDGSERYPVYARWEIEEMLTAAGIKVEAE